MCCLSHQVYKPGIYAIGGANYLHFLNRNSPTVKKSLDKIYKLSMWFHGKIYSHFSVLRVERELWEETHSATPNSSVHVAGVSSNHRALWGNEEL